MVQVLRTTRAGLVTMSPRELLTEARALIKAGHYGAAKALISSYYSVSYYRRLNQLATRFPTRISHGV